MKTNLRPHGAAATRALAAGSLLAAVTFSACSKPPPTEAAPVASKAFDELFPVRVGSQTVRVQVALLDFEVMQGLMFRQSLPPDVGMVFVFSRPQPQEFWMRNVTLPLDIGFFDQHGELKEVSQMYPRDERRVKSHSREIQFCLEMNQGWFARAGVKPGDRLDLTAISAAIRARGFKPEAAGLP